MEKHLIKLKSSDVLNKYFDFSNSDIKDILLYEIDKEKQFNFSLLDLWDV